MESQTYSQSFVEALHRRGIEHVFANSGTDHAPIIEALTVMRHAGLPMPRFHVVPHENLAMSMAQGYYRASGKPAAVLLHVTVGTANAVCSMMNARRANVPVLVFAGRNPLSQEGHIGSRSAPIHWGQDVFDQNALVREYTKWDNEFRAYQDIDALVDRALTIAMSEPRGPVYLSLPRELLADTDKTVHAQPTGIVESAAPSREAIDVVASMLARARQPAIVTSSVGMDTEARDFLEQVAADYAFPIIQHWPGASNTRSDHPMNLRTQGSDWLAEADVILTVDSAVPWVPRNFKPHKNASVIHLGADATYSMYPYRDFPASHLISGTPRHGLRMLAECLAAKAIDEEVIAQRRDRIAVIVDALNQFRGQRISDAEQQVPISAVWIAAVVNKVKDVSAVVVNELGVPFDCLEFTGDSLFIGETTAGGLGSGVGFGLGAKLADRSREVICCVGDGSFMFGNPTPAFVVSDALEIPITIIVSNNGMWYAVEHSTKDIYPEGSSTDEDPLPLTRFGSSPDYAALAMACGAHGETVTEPTDLEDALLRCLEQNRSGKAALLDVITEPGTR